MFNFAVNHVLKYCNVSTFISLFSTTCLRVNEALLRVFFFFIYPDSTYTSSQHQHIVHKLHISVCSLVANWVDNNAMSFRVI